MPKSDHRHLLIVYSPFFFPDKTPRLALLVPDWIAFSTELESRRGAWQDFSHQPPACTCAGTSDSPNSRLLSSLSKTS
jgi:hypothetical protein